MHPAVSSLRVALGPDSVLTDPAVQTALSRDALRPHRGFHAMTGFEQPPLAVVQPDSTQQVMDLVAIARRHALPLVPRGGGSGLMGGALSVRPGIIVDLRRLDRILALDRQALSVRVQSGVRLRTLGAYLDQHGLLLGHDPWSVGVATVGGALSTNGLGYLGGRYGSMGDQVLGLEAVLGTGTVVRTPALRKRSTGPDLTRLFIGAEGTLGIVTEVTLRIFPRPQTRVLLGFTFANFPSGFRALLEMQGYGLQPSSMDLSVDSWPPELQERQTAPEPDTAPASTASPTAYLVLAFDGREAEVAAQQDLARAIALRHAGIPEDKAADLDAYWSTRHSAADRWAADPTQRDGAWLDTPAGKAQLDYLHLSIPVTKLLDFRLRVADRLQTSPIQLCQEAVWIWPECYSLVLYCSPVRDPAAAQTMRQVTDTILRLTQDIGGSIEYVHGIGVRLSHLIQRELGSGMAVLRSLKASLDPAGIMNPGKLGL